MAFFWCRFGFGRYFWSISVQLSGLRQKKKKIHFLLHVTIISRNGSLLLCKIRKVKWKLYSPWNSPGQNTWVGSCSLLQGVFPTQGWSPGLPHCKQILYQLSHQGSPTILEWVAYPSFSRGSSSPRNQARVTCIAGTSEWQFFSFPVSSWSTHSLSFFLFPFQFVSNVNFESFGNFSCSCKSLMITLNWSLSISDGGHCTPPLQGSLLLYKTCNHQCTVCSLAVPGPDTLLMLCVVSDALLPL